MGRNGSGKSSLLWALQGAGRRTGGSVAVAGKDPAKMSRTDAAGPIALVPQQATDLLYHDSIDAECAAADGAAGRRPGTAYELFEQLIAGDGAKPARRPTLATCPTASGWHWHSPCS